MRTLIFVKEPLAGRVKTRLAESIGAPAAADLYRHLIAHCVNSALAAQLGETVLCVAPGAGTDPFLPDLARQHGLRMVPQQGADLGARMAQALRWSLAEGSPTLLIGSDCAALTPSYLHSAALALVPPTDVVLGPAEDGGYFLVGARERCPDVFSGIDWSTARVMEQTRSRLREAGWRWHELAPIWDVDDAKDLARLRQVPAFSGWQR
jgi:rSAM/selenodomain-associated transferase 1